MHTCRPSNEPGVISLQKTRSVFVNFLSKFTTLCAVGIFLLSLFACSGGPKGEVTEKQAFVDSLIATMSLEAKVGEMTQLTLGAILQKENKTIIEPQHLD